MTKEEIAQWVISNRYPKSELDKTSDFEMYHHLVDSIGALLDAQTIAGIELALKKAMYILDGEYVGRSAMMDIESLDPATILSEFKNDIKEG